MLRKKLLVLGMSAVLVGSMAFMTGRGSEETSEAPVVASPTGTYTGVENDGVSEFKGIRYGEFKPFQPATDVTTTEEDEIDATDWGASCIQPYSEVEVASQGECSQDCLFLNVFTKDVTSKDKPVIVWIHGGSYIWGGANDPCYDPQYFVRNLPDEEDCVFVTINYRLNFMGGCDLSSLEGYTDDYAKSRNISKLDQTQALKWVSENIEAWGGDADNVTVMGHSSGGAAVQMLMADPDSNQYFNRIVENSGVQSQVAISKEKVAEDSQKAFEILGVSSIDELTALTDEEINDKIEKITDETDLGNRCADGDVISETWWDDLKNGSAKDIDLLIGAVNGEEDGSAIDWDNSISEPITDPTPIYEMLQERETERAGVYGRYNVLDDPTFYEKFCALGDDKVKITMDLWNELAAPYPSLVTAEAQSAQNENVYLYYWEYAPDKDEVLDYSGDAAEVSPWGRALHTMDVCFEFGTKEGYTELTGDPEKMPDELITMTQTALYNFAKTGDPNGDGVTEWKAYNSDTKYTMVVKADTSWSCESNYRSDVYDLLRTIRPYGESK